MLELTRPLAAEDFIAVTRVTARQPVRAPAAAVGPHDTTGRHTVTGAI